MTDAAQPAGDAQATATAAPAPAPAAPTAPISDTVSDEYVPPTKYMVISGLSYSLRGIDVNYESGAIVRARDLPKGAIEHLIVIGSIAPVLEGV